MRNLLLQSNCSFCELLHDIQITLTCVCHFYLECYIVHNLLPTYFCVLKIYLWGKFLERGLLSWRINACVGFDQILTNPAPPWEYATFALHYPCLKMHTCCQQWVSELSNIGQSDEWEVVSQCSFSFNFINECLYLFLWSQLMFVSHFVGYVRFLSF